MAKHDEDLELVGRMLAGDEEAFDAFAERYSRALYRFASARLAGNRDLTRDTVQTTMTKALAGIESYRGEASLLTWLCSCCRNEILMHFRGRRSAPVEVALDEDSESGVDPRSPRPLDPEAALLQQESARRVHMALDLLPSRYADALAWKYLDHLAVREIGARLELGEKAAESLLARAREAFRASYDRVTGGDPEPAPLDRQRDLRDGPAESHP